MLPVVSEESWVPFVNLSFGQNLCQVPSHAPPKLGHLRHPNRHVNRRSPNGHDHPEDPVDHVSHEVAVAGKRRPKLGTGQRFRALKKKLTRKGVRDPAALSAAIGRKKFGKKRFAKLAAAGRKRRAKK